MTTELDYPVLDIVSSEEIHRELLLLVLKRQKVRDPEAFLKDHAIDSRVIFRNIKTSDGGQMTAAVVLNKAVPKDATTSASGPGEPKNS
jgi:hypothetical protein